VAIACLHRALPMAVYEARVTIGGRDLATGKLSTYLV